MIAFLDSSAIIYLLQGREPFSGRVAETLSSLTVRHRALKAAVSRLAWMECHVAPMRDEDRALLETYDAFFARADRIWVELSQDVVELATAIRVRHRLKTPDALQAASCLQLGRQHLFLTGDASFQSVARLHVVRVA
ncbi:MAG: type II toxin-antitoxin system VapC family toxin [Gammaproteobacteria bacterium]